MKKAVTTILAVCCLAVMLMFSGCYQSYVDTELKITSREGAGTRTIVARIYHPDAPKLPDMKPTDGDNMDQGDYLINGVEPVEDIVKDACRLEDAEITFTKHDDEVYDTLTLSFSFDSVEDYNTKMRTLCGENDPFVEAVLTVEGDQVTWTEDKANFESAMLWAAAAVYGNEENFAPGSGVIWDLFKVDNCKVTIGDHSEVIAVPIDEDPESETNGRVIAGAFSVTGTIDAEEGTGEKPQEKPEENPEENPKTGSSLPVAALMFAAAAGAALTVCACRKGHES